MTKTLLQSEIRYQVRNNLYKFIKRMQRRLCTIFEDRSLINETTIGMMQEVKNLYDDIVTNRMTIWATDDILFLADITDEREFAEAFYNYLIEAEKDAFNRTYNKFFLEIAIDMAYDI